MPDLLRSSVRYSNPLCVMKDWTVITKKIIIQIERIFLNIHGIYYNFYNWSDTD